MENDKFLNDSLGRFTRLASIKFEQGRAQHGGLLWQKKDLILKAKEEVIDMWFYLEALEKQIENKTIYTANGVDIDE